MTETSVQRLQPATADRSLWQRVWYLPIFMLYLALVLVTALHHEPWFDEGQAWLLARDLPPGYLLTNIMRHEGSPGLWHLLLLLPAKLGIPYAALNVISALIAAAGILLFLSRSPLPKALTALLPFTFFLCYQYAVVARSYVLLPILLFAIAAMYREKRRHALLYTILLCLLANVSIHGFLIASSLMLLHFIDLLRDWRATPVAERQRNISLLALFAGVLACIVWQLWLPADILSVTGHRDSLLARTVMSVQTVNDALTEIGVLTIGIVLVSLWWFFRTRVLLCYLLPTLALLAFFALKYSNSWHEGILFLVWLFALWRSFDAYAHLDAAERQALSLQLPRNAVIAAVVLLVAVQFTWTFQTVRHDIAHNYSASKDVADYLIAHDLTSANICAYGFHANGILPYFPRNIFANFDNKHGSSFWFWSKRQRTDRTLHDVLQRQPDIIILGIKFDSLSKFPWEDPTFSYDISSDYRYVGYFDGKMYWKNRVKEYDAFALYQRK